MYCLTQLCNFNILCNKARLSIPFIKTANFNFTLKKILVVNIHFLKDRVQQNSTHLTKVGLIETDQKNLKFTVNKCAIYPNLNIRIPSFKVCYDFMLLTTCKIIKNVHTNKEMVSKLI